MSAAGERTPGQSGSNPFTARTALALVLFGSLVFVALLWMIGNGLTLGSTNDGGAHADGRGLNGYAALAAYLERRGYAVERARSEAGFRQPGLLVLTPPAQAEATQIARAVARHRAVGPTLLVTPKWLATPASPEDGAGKTGWVRLVGPGAPRWPGFLDDVSLAVDGAAKRTRMAWHARGIDGTFPEPRLVMSGAGPRLVPLVVGDDGRIYAAYLADGDYPALAALAPPGAVLPPSQRAKERYPLVIVFDPDLLDNYGMAQVASAWLTEALVRATTAKGATVTFDLTLNGLGRTANLLTLAFTPPFLAATLCLLLAAGGVGWRAFLRFGPPRAAGRAIAYGKQALVANAAGLIRRANRLHLLGTPYADAARQRLARGFALPRDADVASELAVIDRAARAAGAGDHAFSQAAARLSRARSAGEIVKAAQDLHALERTLTP